MASFQRRLSAVQRGHVLAPKYGFKFECFCLGGALLPGERALAQPVPDMLSLKPRDLLPRWVAGDSRRYPEKQFTRVPPKR
jgi:hypothetical protein